MSIVSDICFKVKRKYGKCIVVFDGYPQTPTKKDMAHRKRYGQPVQIMELSANSVLSVSLDELLGNNQSKSQLIHILKSSLEKEQITVFCASDDADRMIASKALDSANRMNTVIVAEDTDIIVLLWSALNETAYDIHVQDENKCWDIKQLVKEEGLQK